MNTIKSLGKNQSLWHEASSEDLTDTPIVENMVQPFSSAPLTITSVEDLSSEILQHIFRFFNQDSLAWQRSCQVNRCFFHNVQAVARLEQKEQIKTLIEAIEKIAKKKLVIDVDDFFLERSSLCQIKKDTLFIKNKIFTSLKDVDLSAFTKIGCSPLFLEDLFLLIEGYQLKDQAQMLTEEKQAGLLTFLSHMLLRLDLYQEALEIATLIPNLEGQCQGLSAMAHQAALNFNFAHARSIFRGHEMSFRDLELARICETLIQQDKYSEALLFCNAISREYFRGKVFYLFTRSLALKGRWVEAEHWAEQNHSLYFKNLSLIFLVRCFTCLEEQEKVTEFLSKIALVAYKNRAYSAIVEVLVEKRQFSQAEMYVGSIEVLDIKLIAIQTLIEGLVKDGQWQKAREKMDHLCWLSRLQPQFYQDQMKYEAVKNNTCVALSIAYLEKGEKQKGQELWQELQGISLQRVRLALFRKELERSITSAFRAVEGMDLPVNLLYLAVVKHLATKVAWAINITEVKETLEQAIHYAKKIDPYQKECVEAYQEIVQVYGVHGLFDEAIEVAYAASIHFKNTDYFSLKFKCFFTVLKLMLEKQEFSLAILYLFDLKKNVDNLDEGPIYSLFLKYFSAKPDLHFNSQEVQLYLKQFVPSMH